jgi:hypothetical protein
MRVHGLIQGGRRTLLGITGPPGAAKTTFADALAARLTSRPPVGTGGQWVARVPMDGYHLEAFAGLGPPNPGRRVPRGLLLALNTRLRLAGGSGTKGRAGAVVSAACRR